MLDSEEVDTVTMKKVLVYREGDSKIGTGLTLIEIGASREVFHGPKVCPEGGKGINLEESTGVVYVGRPLTVPLTTSGDVGSMVESTDINVEAISD